MIDHSPRIPSSRTGGPQRRVTQSPRGQKGSRARSVRRSGVIAPCGSVSWWGDAQLGFAEPVPYAAPPAGLSSSSRDIGSLGFAVAGLPRSNLLLGPGESPARVSPLDEVVAPARQPPVADRGPDADGLTIVLEAPFASAQWQADFRAAATGAEVLRQSVLHRYV